MHNSSIPPLDTQNPLGAAFVPVALLPTSKTRAHPQTPLEASFSLLTPGTCERRTISVFDEALRSQIPITPLTPSGRENLRSGSHPRLAGPMIVKPRQIELDTPPSLAALGLNQPSSESAIFPPGTGPFIEVLVATYAQQLLKKAHFPEQNKPRLPQICYGVMGHEGMFLHYDDLKPLPVRGTGSFQERIPDCSPCSLKTLNACERLSVEILAVIDLITLAGDRHPDNLLIDPQGRLVLIDHGRSLSVGGSKVKVFWQQSQHVQSLPSAEIQGFIQSLDDSLLEKTAKSLSLEIQEQLRQLPAEQSRDEIGYIHLPFERILPHQITIAYVKAAASQMSLARMAQAIQGDIIARQFYLGNGIIHRIYQDVLKLSPEERHPAIDHLVQNAIQQFLEEKPAAIGETATMHSSSHFSSNSSNSGFFDS